MVLSFNPCGNNLPAVYDDILRNAAMQVGMQNMMGGIGNVFGGGGYGYGVQPYAQVAPAQQAQDTTPKITKEQVDLAYDNYNNLVQLCLKAEAYKNNSEAKLETLEANKATAEKGVLAKDQELASLNGQLLQAKANKAPQNQIDALEAKIKQIEKERVEAQKEVERAKVEIDAFQLAQEGNEEKLKQVIAQKDEAYKQFQAISQQYTQQQAEERAVQEAAENRQEDKEAAGSWWGRSKCNPKNWTNMNFKGEADSSANIAKCLRILNGKGRAEAIEYALKHNLITKTGDNQYETTHKELQELVELD